MSPKDKPLSWLHDQVKTQPFFQDGVNRGRLFAQAPVFAKKTEKTPDEIIRIAEQD